MNIFELIDHYYAMRHEKEKVGWEEKRRIWEIFIFQEKWERVGCGRPCFKRPKKDPSVSKYARKRPSEGQASWRRGDVAGPSDWKKFFEKSVAKKASEFEQLWNQKLHRESTKHE